MIIWSPSVSVDSNWTAVKRYIQYELKVDIEMEKCFFDEYTLEALDKVQKQQHNPCSVILNTPIFKGVLSGNPGFAQLRKIFYI